MRARPLGWGVIGCGWVARDYALPAIEASAASRLVAVCDPRPTPGLPRADDLDALLADPDVTAVYIATPNHLHTEQIVAAAQAGKHILCEKPLCRTTGEADKIARAVREAGIHFATAYDQRHHPAHVAMRELIAGGALGTVTLARIHYACWLPRNWTADNWRVEAARAGGGAAIDLAPHGVDLLTELMGEEPVAIQAMLQSAVQDYAVDDGAVLTLAFPSGALASLAVAYNCPDDLPRRRLELIGTRGMLQAENTMGQTAGGQLLFRDAAGGTSREIAFDTQASPFDRQIDRFARLCLNEGTFPGSPERDLRLTVLLLDALATAQTFHAGKNTNAA